MDDVQRWEKLMSTQGGRDMPPLPLPGEIAGVLVGVVGDIRTLTYLTIEIMPAGKWLIRKGRALTEGDMLFGYTSKNEIGNWATARDVLTLANEMSVGLCKAWEVWKEMQGGGSDGKSNEA